MCEDRPHLHTAVHSQLLPVRAGASVLVINQVGEAIIVDPHLAARVVELLERHGLADTPAALVSPWPAPDPLDRKVDLIPKEQR